MLAKSLAVWKCVGLGASVWIASINSASAEEVASIEQRLAGGVRFLASDRLEGRGLGSAGIEQAADYIHAEMKSAGLLTELGEGGPFQPFNYTVSVKRGEKCWARFVEAASLTTSPLTLDTQFTPLAIGGSGAVDAPLVFAGYGITAPDLEYDDYAGIDVAGKAVIIMRREPQQNDPSSRFGGTDDTPHASFRSKIRNAIDHGAVAILFCTDKPEIDRQLADHDRRVKALQLQISKADNNSPDEKASAARSGRGHSARLAQRLEVLLAQRARNEQGLLAFAEAGTAHDGTRIPVLSCGRDAIDSLLATLQRASLAEWEAAVDESGSAQSFACGDWRFQADVVIDRVELPVKNVVGVVQGAGPLADEMIVIGAHYDHLGLGGSRENRGQVHNGADDNASGTTVLLELARRFGQRESAPARRLVFVAFTAEEKGLLGSVHYVNNPPFPLESTMAMLNFDMVGRVKDNQLWVNGVGTAALFSQWLAEDNQRSGFSLQEIPGGKGPSDHATFCNKQIPVLHFFTGMHQEYHRPSDDFDLVNIEGMRRLCDLAEAFVDRLARHPDGLEFVDAKGPSMPPRGGAPQGPRAWFGIRVQADYTGDGFAVAEVVERSPAASAGVVAGDVVVRLGATTIAGLDAFQRQLAERKPGDQITVTLRRDGVEQTVTATLASAPH